VLLPCFSSFSFAATQKSPARVWARLRGRLARLGLGAGIKRALTVAQQWRSAATLGIYPCVGYGKKAPCRKGSDTGQTGCRAGGQEIACRRVNIITTGVLNKGTLPGESHDPMALGAHSVGNGLSGRPCAAQAARLATLAIVARLQQPVAP
jgi:hypothetical protein